MKNVTLSADEHLIERARDLARARRSTLNAMFREWLEEMTRREDLEKRLIDLDKTVSYARPGRRFTREEMNAR